MPRDLSRRGARRAPIRAAAYHGGVRDRVVLLGVLVLGALVLAGVTAVVVEQLTADDQPAAEAFEAPAFP